jgi:hypothetical protein
MPPNNSIAAGKVFAVGAHHPCGAKGLPGFLFSFILKALC